MSDEIKKSDDDAGDAKKTDEAKAETMEAKVRRRVLGAISDEVYKLEARAETWDGDDERVADYCRVMESLASIKAKAELYCIQVEMSAQTAAMASLFGSAMRARQAEVADGAPDGAPPGAGNIAEVMRRASRPGGNSQQDG